MANVITERRSIDVLRTLRDAYQALPFYKRFFFRLATLPFSVGSWSSSKNPATLNPEKTTQHDLSRLAFFFQHCRPAFFRSVFGLKPQFEKGLMELRGQPVAPSSTVTAEPVVTPSLFTPPAVGSVNVLPADFLSDFFKTISLSTERQQDIEGNFTQLNQSSDTKEASLVYQLIGSLLMIPDRQCIEIAIRKMHETAPQNETDRHIQSARFKADVVIEKVFASLSKEERMLWQPFNDALWASLTAEEQTHITDKAIFRSIIQSVLIPDTLMMGMHPLQDSVLAKRKMIAYNPRVQFIDESWANYLNRFQRDSQEINIPNAILDDFKRRTFSLNYGDGYAYGKQPYSCFIAAHEKQYQRIIFDWSCLCDVRYGFLYLQKVLRPNGKIYTQDGGYFLLERMPDGFVVARKNIVGKMIGSPCNWEQPHADHWFLLQAQHEATKSKPLGFYTYQRTDLPFEKPPINQPVTEALVAQAREKLGELGASNTERVIGALISAQVNRYQATEAVRRASLLLLDAVVVTEESIVSSLGPHIS